jgi:hypothetical protein
MTAQIASLSSNNFIIVKKNEKSAITRECTMYIHTNTGQIMRLYKVLSDVDELVEFNRSFIHNLKYTYQFLNLKHMSYSTFWEYLVDAIPNTLWDEYSITEDGLRLIELYLEFDEALDPNVQLDLSLLDISVPEGYNRGKQYLLNNPTEIFGAPDVFKSDKELLGLLVALDLSVLNYIDLFLLDQEVVKSCITRDITTLLLFPNYEWESDLQLVKQMIHEILHSNNADMMRTFLNSQSNSPIYIEEREKCYSDKNFVTMCLRHCSNLFHLTPEYWKQDPDIIVAIKDAVFTNISLLNGCPESIIGDERYMHELVLEVGYEPLEYISESLKNNKDFFLGLMQTKLCSDETNIYWYGPILLYASSTLLHDERFMRRALANRSFYIFYISEKYSEDIQLHKVLIGVDPRSYTLFARAVFSNRELVKYIIEHVGTGKQLLTHFLPREMLNDQELMLPLVAGNTEEYAMLSNELKYNVEFTMKLIENNLDLYKRIPLALRENESVALVAIKQNPFMLKYLKGNKIGIALAIAAVTKNSHSVKYIPHKIMTDLFVTTVYRQCEVHKNELLKYASVPVQKQLLKEEVLKNIGTLDYKQIKKLIQEFKSDSLFIISIMLECPKKKKYVNKVYKATGKKLKRNKEFVMDVLKQTQVSYLKLSSTLKKDPEISKLLASNNKL